MTLSYGRELQPWEIAVAKKLVNQFTARSRSLKREDFDDILQDCLLRWIEARSRLDPHPDEPPVAYMKKVVRHRLVDLFRSRTSLKRRGDLDAQSLDAPVGDAEDAPSLVDLLGATAGEHGEHDDPVDAQDARIDLARAIRRLTDSQRRLCQLLGDEGLSIKEAAQRLGIPRGTLYEEIKRIRKVFAEHGLGDYLKR